MRRTVRAALALALVLSAAGSASASAGTPKRWVMGYYVGYQRNLMPANEIDWGAMTHIVVGPVNPRANGALDTAFDIDNTAGPAMAKDIAKRAKAHSVVPLLMIGGAGEHDNFLAAAKNHLSTLVHNLAKVMNKFGYRGLDLDWEPINASDQQYVTELVNRLRGKVPNAVLTMPVLPITKTFAHVASFYGKIAKKLDRISVMTYGMAGPYQGWRTWHSSALQDATASMPSAVNINVTQFEKAGVPAAKLGVGTGFYGTCWTGGVTGPRQDIGDSTVAADDNAMSYTTIMSSYYQASAYHYDSKAQAPYLGFTSPHGPQNCTFVSYENARSIEAKARWAKAQGLGALIVWTVNQGHNLGAPAGHRDVLLAKAKHAFGA
ncbi:MAG TPA: glycoside hydrolase family 18 protein [Jatrophihabitantaceae bacterium]|jgi:chitinase|nr:glycoside hydrolase family 18 protein [Jatrophihabitantaceae bacterium]